MDHFCPKVADEAAAISINNEAALGVDECILQELCGDEDQQLLEEIRALETSSDMQTISAIRGISDYVTRLNKLSHLVLNASQSARWIHAERSTTEVVDCRPYVQNVKDKYQERLDRDLVDAWLLERFGLSNAKRRQYIVYCRAHRDRIAGQSAAAPAKLAINDAHPQAKTFEQSRLEKFKTAEPSLHRTVASKPCIPTTGLLEREIDDGFDDGASFSTAAHSFKGVDEVSLRSVPQLNEFAQPREWFECPYCSTIQRFNGQRGWK